MAMNPRLLRPRASGFSPQNIAKLGLWLDASAAASLTFNGNTVSEWRDLSGNARNYSQATAAQQPNGVARSQNGKVVLDFGGGQALAGNAAAKSLSRNVAGLTIIAVCKLDGANLPTVGGLQMFVFFSNNAIASRAALHFDYNSLQLRIGGRRLDADSFQAFGFTQNANANVLSGVIDYANSDAFIFQNGTQQASETNFLTSGNTSDTDSGAAAIGASVDAAGAVSANQLDGFVGEVCIYTRVLSSTERLRVERYMGRKWGITVA